MMIVLDKPMTRVFPELHEDLEEFSMDIFRRDAMEVLREHGPGPCPPGPGLPPGLLPPPSLGGPGTARSCVSSESGGGYKIKRQSKKKPEVNKNDILREAFCVG